MDIKRLKELVTTLYEGTVDSYKPKTWHLQIEGVYQEALKEIDLEVVKQEVKHLKEQVGEGDASNI